MNDQKIPDQISIETYRAMIRRGKTIPTRKRVAKYPHLTPPWEQKIKDPPMKVPDDPKTTVFIPYNVPSKKNSYRIIKKKPKNPKPGVFGKLYVYSLGKSSSINKYEAFSEKYYRQYAEWFRLLTATYTPPIVVEMQFVRSSQRSRWDFNNASHIVCDMMVTHGWVPDDNIDNLLPIPVLDGRPRWLRDDKIQGVFIKVVKYPAINGE